MAVVMISVQQETVVGKEPESLWQQGEVFAADFFCAIRPEVDRRACTIGILRQIFCLGSLQSGFSRLFRFSSGLCFRFVRSHHIRRDVEKERGSHPEDQRCVYGGILQEKSIDLLEGPSFREMCLGNGQTDRDISAA